MSEGEFDRVDRPRGMFTQKDREYLTGATTPETRNAEYQQRWRIRKRLTNAVEDFLLLEERLTTEDVEKMFEETWAWADTIMESLEDAETAEDVQAGEPPAFLRGWASALSFFWFVFGNRYPDLGAKIVREEIAYAATDYYLQVENVYRDVQVGLTIAEGEGGATPLEEIAENPIENLPEGEPSVGESILTRLVETGSLTPEEAATVYGEKYLG